jgi:hypothetical protein
LHWIHSRKKFLEDILRIQDEAIEEENQEKIQLEIQLGNMKRPFGFIQSYYAKEQFISADPSMRVQLLTLNVHDAERKIEHTFDVVTSNLA